MNPNNIPAPPESISATTILSRLMDGLSFRYTCATEGITQQNLTFRPCDSSMNMLELFNHIYDLAVVTDQVLNNQEVEHVSPINNFSELREKTIALYSKNSIELREMTDKTLAKCTFRPKNKPNEYPFWNLINGPIADALTHVGQITSWRRMDGNPIPKNNPFLGTIG